MGSKNEILAIQLTRSNKGNAQAVNLFYQALLKLNSIINL